MKGIQSVKLSRLFLFLFFFAELWKCAISREKEGRARSLEILDAFLGGVHGQNKYHWLETGLLEGANRSPQPYCSGATSFHTGLLSLEFTAPKPDA